MKYIVTILCILMVTLPSVIDAQWRGWDNASEKAEEELDDDPVDEIAIPVLLGVDLNDITPNFGDPRGGGTRSHEGLDMMSPLGTPVVSPTKAVVRRVGTGDSAGNYVYTYNPGGEVFAYLHLDEIADDLDEGDVLDKGDFIGTVGYTGNAVASAPHLHFEIHVDGEPTDPLPRIKETFDTEEKMGYLEEILDDMSSSDEEDLVELITQEFRNEIHKAQEEEVDIPEAIEEDEEVLQDAHFTEEVDEEDIHCEINYYRLITLWTRGEDVKQVQRCMNSLNFDTGVVDGIYGPKTYTGITAYQRAAGLRYVDGIVGPETSSALNSLS